MINMVLLFNPVITSCINYNMLLLLFIPIITACFEYNMNDCITNNCLYCVLNVTNSGYCMSLEFYEGTLCNQTCCNSIIRLNHEEPVPNYIIALVLLFLLTPIIAFIIITLMISIRSPCYEIV
jgi:hypothetical protein